MRNTRTIAVRRELKGNLTGSAMLLGGTLALSGVFAGDKLSVLSVALLCLGGSLVFWKGLMAHLNR